MSPSVPKDRTIHGPESPRVSTGRQSVPRQWERTRCEHGTRDARLVKPRQWILQRRPPVLAEEREQPAEQPLRAFGASATSAAMLVERHARRDVA